MPKLDAPLLSTFKSMLESVEMSQRNLSPLLNQNSAEFGATNKELPLTATTAKQIEEAILNVYSSLNLYSSRFDALIRRELDRITLHGLGTYSFNLQIEPKMIIHNASDKFIYLHEPRIRDVLRAAGGSPKWFTMKLRESIPRVCGTVDLKAVYYIITLELVTKNDPQTGDIVLTPQTEIDLSTIEAWEARNEKFTLNDF